MCLLAEASHAEWLRTLYLRDLKAVLHECLLSSGAPRATTCGAMICSLGVTLLYDLASEHYNIRDKFTDLFQSIIFSLER